MDRLFEVCLALCDLSALVSLHVQYRGLFGDRGILPARESVTKLRKLLDDKWRHDDARPTDGDARPTEEAVPAGGGGESGGWRDTLTKKGRRWIKLARRQATLLRLLPTIFALTGASNAAMEAMFIAGYVACAALCLGFAPSLAALTVAVVHGSFTSVGGAFMGLQFESFLVESNVVFAAGHAFSAVAPWLWAWMLRWLVFRLMLAAGAGKLASGDPAWRASGDGSALTYHYLTQPLPNAVSRFMHRLPSWWHALETRATFFFEGPLALSFFMSSPTARWVGFLGTLGFNLAMGLTGNYGHLHALTVTDALAIVATPAWGCGSEGGGDATGGALALIRRWTTLPCPSVPVTWAGAALHYAWLLIGCGVGLAYVAVSFVPFALNFEGLVEASRRGGS
jgi:hypothetical protein